MKRYLSLTLHIISLLATVALAITHLHIDSISTIVAIAITIGLGYWIGMWTCHFHKRQQGLWVTVAIFVLLNLLHSMIDGASIGGMESFAAGIAVLTHELARQPVLYLVLWGMLAPFIVRRRLVVVPIAVTGVWLVGAYMGYQLFTQVNDTPWLANVAHLSLFLFMGDIIHHVLEEYKKLRTSTSCCHDSH